MNNEKNLPTHFNIGKNKNVNTSLETLSLKVDILTENLHDLTNEVREIHGDVQEIRGDVQGLRLETKNIYFELKTEIEKMRQDFNKQIQNIQGWMIEMGKLIYANNNLANKNREDIQEMKQSLKVIKIEWNRKLILSVIGVTAITNWLNDFLFYLFRKTS